MLSVSFHSAFPDNYDRGLYRAHIEAVYKGLLIHLDDPSVEIQVGNRLSEYCSCNYPSPLS